MKKRILYSLLLTALTLNLLLGARLYFSYAQAGEKDDVYQNIELFTRVLERVRNEYVDGDNVTYKELIYSALRGMLSSLDPHSEFMDAEKYNELKNDTEGAFGGLGISIGMRDNFLTVIYQIDRDCRRLLWVGKRRTQAALRRGLAALGEEVVGGLRFVCSDMWKAYLKVIAAKAGQALHVLDRFHITTHLNQAVDQVRRAESGRLRAIASAQAAHLKNMRWKLLRRGSRVRGKARQQLNALAASKLVTARAWILKEIFQHFWSYRSLTWARYFLDYWTWRALRSRIEPMMRVARMLRAHQELILNWFRAKGEISSGAVEGLNNKIRVVTRRSYGFRTYDAMEIALYHTLGRLPEPELTHRFC